MMLLAQDDPISWPAALVVTVLVTLAMVAAGVVTLAVARRTADGRIGPNAVAGIRTRATRSSDAAWLAAHQAGRRDTERGGWAAVATAPFTVLLAVATGLTSGDTDTYMIMWVVLVLVTTAVLLVFVLRGALVGHRAAKAVLDGFPPPDPDPFEG